MRLETWLNYTTRDTIYEMHSFRNFLGESDTQQAAAILGIEPGSATPETVRDAYRSRAKVVHPDAGGDQKQFVSLRSAYDHFEKLFAAGVRSGSVPALDIAAVTSLVVDLDAAFKGAEASIGQADFGPKVTWLISCFQRIRTTVAASIPPHDQNLIYWDRRCADLFNRILALQKSVGSGRSLMSKNLARSLESELARFRGEIVDLIRHIAKKKSHAEG